MKQTEIGLIPDDWKVEQLNEYFEVGSSKRVFQSQWRKAGIPFYRAREIVILSEKNTVENELFIDESLYNQFKTLYGVPSVNDLLVTGVGTLGKVYKVQDTKPFYFKDGNIICLKNKGLIDSDYVKYHFDYSIVKNQINDNSGKSTVGTYTINSARKTLIPIPPLAEQQRIAKALSDVDAVINTTEKLIQKKKNIKQGAMQSLLTGKKRLPGFAATSKFKQTELGEIPEDWEVKALHDIFEFRPNNTFTRDNLNDSEGIYQNIHYGDILIKYPNILDCSKASIPYVNDNMTVKYSNYGVKEGDIIIADTAEDETVGKVVEIYNIGKQKLVAGLHTFLCRKITDDFAPKWLGYFMNHSIFHDQVLPYITGTKVSAISRGAIQNLKVFIPSKTEQRAVASVLSDMDAEIENLSAKLQKYRNLKTAMMQQLLTGKIRL